MKIAIIGTGYVGLPSGVGFASFGNKVVCIDKDEAKIKALQSGKPTLYEDGLEELFLEAVRSGNLRFTTSTKDGVQDADVVILAVGTPPHPETKEADLRYIYAAAEELAPHITGYTVVANKSTVPVGTGDAVENIIKKTNPSADFDVVSLPEFLREGYALYDFFHPDRIVAGCNTLRAENVIKELYAPFENKTEMLFVKRKSSETIKYASNAFLAMKIHYINEMADFCEKAGADVDEVARGMGLDKRIGNKFLNAGVGFGGSCFPKDTMAMAYMGRMVGTPIELIETTIAGNKKRKEMLAERVLTAIKDIPEAKIAVWGLAFKNGTDDCRESPAMDVIRFLLEHKADITAYDPRAMGNACQILGNRIAYADDMYAAAKDADVLVILTEWKQFAGADLQILEQIMRHKKILDFRNMLCPEEVLAAGFEYRCIGKKTDTLKKIR